MPERRPLPDSIEIRADAAEGMTPNEMRQLKAASGLRLDYLVQQSDWDEKTQMAVWLALYRAGYEATWDEAGDVRPITVQAEPDPTNEGP